MSNDTPITDAIELLDRPARHKALWDKCAEFERENARLREDEKGLLQDIARLTEEAFKRDEELAEAKRAAIDYMEKWHKAIHQRDAAQVTANLLQHAQAAIDAERKRAEQAEARALEYKTEHAALLGTSQWQEVEIADLRDDVKRLMQTVSECEERALANEKDAAVAKFGATCFAEHRDEMSDLDGGWLHEKALECGLIYGKEVTAEMWDGCGSVHCECEVGDICYFPTDAGKAAISGAKHEG